MRLSRSRGVTAAVAAAGLFVPTLAVVGTAQADDLRDRPLARLTEAVTLDATMEHLRAFQQIADVSEGNRAAGTGGYAASAGYVAGQLAAAGYQVELLPFDFAFWQQNAPNVLERVTPDPTTYDPELVGSFTYAPTGDVTAPVEAVDLVLPPPAEPGSTSGCEPEDFAGFTPGNVALLQRGTCTFEQKALNAQAAGAVAAIIFNEGQEGRTETLTGTLGNPSVAIPVVGVSFELGVELSAPGTQVRVATDTTSEIRTTYNVVAESARGRDDNVVMAGAHLDSVLEGPGINDNGSGSAALLEVAIRFAEEIKYPRNTVRFAWWSAEELGLLGADAYVAARTEEQLADIALYLNFDMVASPNFARFVYDGDDSDGEGAGPGPDGSAAIEGVFERFYANRGLPSEGTDFSGRSDYGPFIAVGIPAGGLFTGAEEIKTEEQAALYGGTAGEAFDPCYHLACDTIDNVDQRALEQNADAIAFAVGYFAFNTTGIPERDAAMAAMASAARSQYGHDHRGHALRS